MANGGNVIAVRKSETMVVVLITSPITYREATQFLTRSKMVFTPDLGRRTVLVHMTTARVYSPDVAEKILRGLAWLADQAGHVIVMANATNTISHQVNENVGRRSNCWVLFDPQLLPIRCRQLLPATERAKATAFFSEGFSTA